MKTAPLLPMLLRQTRAQLVANFRVPAFVISGVLLPVMFFAFFGWPNVHQSYGPVNAGRYLLASFGAYGMSSIMVFSFGIGVATERGQKMDLLQRATPMPPLLYMVARLLTAIFFGLLTVAALFAFGVLVAGVSMDLGTALLIAARLVLGSIPFIGLGFAIGYGFGPNAAPGVANLVYLPLSFASGLFFPLRLMPEFVRHLGPYLPTYHYGQLVWNAVGAGDESLGWAALWLAGYTLVFFLLASRVYWRDETAKFA